MAKKKDLIPEEKLQQAFVPKEEQPYPLPDGWRWVRLESICEVIMGQSPNGVETTDDSSYMPLIGGAADMGELYLQPHQYTKKPTKISKADDLILCIRATLGHPNFADGEYCLGRGVAAIRSNLCSKEFLRYMFLNFEQYLYDNATGSTFLSIGSSALKSMPVPFPSQAEQVQIVEKINSYYQRLDEASKLIQHVLNLSEQRKAAILHKAFTGELTTKWREEKNITLDSWRHLTLNDVAEYKKGPFGSSIKKSMFVPKGKNTYKVYEQGNAIRKTIDYGNYYITYEKFLELQSNEVKAGDIIISCAGTIGEVYKLPENCEKGIINQALMRVRLFNNVIERFFILYFSEILKSSVEVQANGTAIKNIPPFKIMKAMPVILPTISEQQEIIATLDNLLGKEQRVVDMAKQNLRQISLMKRSILENAFRGMLNVKDKNKKSFEC